MLINITHPSVYVKGEPAIGLTEVDKTLGEKLIKRGFAEEGIEDAVLVVNPDKDEKAIKAKLKEEIKAAGGDIPAGNASIETLEKALEEAKA